MEGTESLAERLRCLDRPIDPPFAAHVHRVFAVRAFIGRQGDDTAAALRAAVAADPTYVWPTTILPEAHSLRDLYAESSPRSDGLPLVPPTRGHLRFDGVDRSERPTDRPTLMQVIDDDGTVLASGWLRPADPLLPYDARRPLLPPLPAPARALRASLLVTAAAGAVGAGASYAATAGPTATFRTTADRETLERSQRTANALVGTSIASGAIGVGAGVGALLVGRL